jgi:hypothetical protein
MSDVFFAGPSSILIEPKAACNLQKEKITTNDTTHIICISRK